MDLSTTGLNRLFFSIQDGSFFKEHPNLSAKQKQALMQAANKFKGDLNSFIDKKLLDEVKSTQDFRKLLQSITTSQPAATTPEKKTKTTKVTSKKASAQRESQAAAQAAKQATSSITAEKPAVKAASKPKDTEANKTKTVPKPGKKKVQKASQAAKTQEEVAPAKVTKPASQKKAKTTVPKAEAAKKDTKTAPAKTNAPKKKTQASADKAQGEVSKATPSPETKKPATKAAPKAEAKQASQTEAKVAAQAAAAPAAAVKEAATEAEKAKTPQNGREPFSTGKTAAINAGANLLYDLASSIPAIMKADPADRGQLIARTAAKSVSGSVAGTISAKALEEIGGVIGKALGSQDLGRLIGSALGSVAGSYLGRKMVDGALEELPSSAEKKAASAQEEVANQPRVIRYEDLFKDAALSNTNVSAPTNLTPLFSPQDLTPVIIKSNDYVAPGSLKINWDTPDPLNATRINYNLATPTTTTRASRSTSQALANARALAGQGQGQRRLLKVTTPKPMASPYVRSSTKASVRGQGQGRRPQQVHLKVTHLRVGQGVRRAKKSIR